MGLATLCSRLLGFARDIVIARLFGVYTVAQAFVIAFRIPNLFRDFLGEGAANAAIVPVLSEYSIKRSKEEFWELANVVLNLLLVILSAVTVLGIIFSPLLVRMIAPGFVSDPVKLAETIQLNRVIFPYILLIGLAAYSTAILNSLKHFSVPAFAPCLLNISIIACALLFGQGITGLASGVLLGGVLQLLIQIPVLYRKGFSLRLFKKFRHPGAKVIAGLMLPRIGSSCIYQLNNFVDSVFGSLAFIVGEGGVAILYFAYRLVQFPLGIFGNALAQVILPTFSVQALENDHEQLKKTLFFGLRVIFFLMLPASAAFIALAQPVIRTVFEGGRFDAYSTAMTAKVLFFYSFGLFAYASTKILQTCFFALKDTATPTKVSGLTLAMNIILISALIFPLKISGIALANSVSGIISFLVLFKLLKRRLGLTNVTEIVTSFLKTLSASICMASVCYILNKNINFGNSFFDKVLYLIALMVCGVLSYIFFCFIFRVREIRDLRSWVSKKLWLT